MKVLIACEFSGIVRDAFLAEGYDAISCDLQPTEVEGPHYEGDVRDILYDGWDLMIGHPSCRYLANSSVHLLHSDPTRWAKLVEGAAFFKLLLSAPIRHIAIENPIIHRYAADLIGERQTQIIQPWMFGDGEQKQTGLWLRNLPNLEPTDITIKWEQRIIKESPSAERWKNRSRTYPGIARAMATQWGAYAASING